MESSSNSSLYKNKKVLITGGLGFIGKSFARRLLNEETEVYILDNFSYGKGDWYTQGAYIINGDVANKADWAKLPHCDYVFHFGAPSSIILFNENVTKCTNVTIAGLLNAFEWSVAHQVKKLIYPSSGSIFGVNKKSSSEVTIPSPVNTYGKTKLACEYIAKVYENVMPSVGLRIFAGYGPGEDHKGRIASLVTQFLRCALDKVTPTIYGDGKQTRDFVYIDDIVDTLYFAADSAVTGVLNVGSGQSISFNELITMLSTLLLVDIKPEYIPKPTLYLQDTACNTKSLTAFLGRKPIPITEGLTRYMATIQKTI